MSEEDNDCPTCNGTGEGRSDYTSCSQCRGSGVTQVDRTEDDYWLELAELFCF